VPESASSTTGALASQKGKLPIRGPVAPIPKIDPQAMKEYRLEICYFGTLTLRQARDAYLASLGKDEPSEKKIPSFGAPGVAPPTLAGVPRSIPLPSAAPSAAPAAGPSGSAAAGAPPRKPVDLGIRAPHERNARACTVAAGLKEPAMGDVDAALAAFAPYSLELSRNIAAASVYYQREEYKADTFQKGKELHKKLVADFAKLDDLSEKLGAAINAFRKEHPADASKREEGEKLVETAYDKARTIILTLIGTKIDMAAYKTTVADLEKSVDAVKEFGTKNASDPWTSVTSPGLIAFVKAAKDTEAKTTEKGIEPDAFISMINAFTGLVDAKHRALSRALIAKGQTIEPRAGANLPLRPQIPPPNVGSAQPTNNAEGDEHKQ